jgi:hypothetical protein
MEEHGYDHIEEERLGSFMVFIKDGVRYQGFANGGLISYFREENT